MPINIYLLTYMYLLKWTNKIQKLVSYVDKNVHKISPWYQSQKCLNLPDIQGNLQDLITCMHIGQKKKYKKTDLQNIHIILKNE